MRNRTLASLAQATCCVSAVPRQEDTVSPLWRVLLVAVPPCQTRKMPQSRTAHDTRSARWSGQLMRREQLPSPARTSERGRPSEDISEGRETRGWRTARLDGVSPQNAAPLSPSLFSLGVEYLSFLGHVVALAPPPAPQSARRRSPEPERQVRGWRRISRRRRHRRPPPHPRAIARTHSPGRAPCPSRAFRHSHPLATPRKHPQRQCQTRRGCRRAS